MKVAVLNGPNLNLQGKRETDVYGTFTMEQMLESVKKIAGPNNEVVYYQSNHEGDLIDFIHNSKENKIDYIIFNPGAYTHTSVALLDAIVATGTKVIEIHISNIYAREEFRQKSITASGCVGQISGFGMSSYELAMKYIIEK